MALPPLSATLVGSYPQPEWLIDRDALLAGGVPRVGMPGLWRVPEALRPAAQDDAVRLALRDQERAGVDLVTDGEMRRESYFNWLAPALTGIDTARPGLAMSRAGRPTPVPRVVGPLARPHPVLAAQTAFLRAETSHRIKVAMPGPFTMTVLAQDEHYLDAPSLAMAFAEVVNQELRDVKAAGADVLQLDEPYLDPRAAEAREYGVAAITRALVGLPGPVVIHLCFGYAHTIAAKPDAYTFLTELAATPATHVSIEAAQPRLDLAALDGLPRQSIVLGVLDLGDPAVETPEQVAGRIRAALAHVPPERLVVGPDCGMKYLPRERALGKLRAMVAGRDLVRAELGLAGD